MADYEVRGWDDEYETRGWDDEPEKESGLIRRAVGDTGVSLAKGIISFPEAIVGLADIPTGGMAGKLAESAGFRPRDAKAFLDELYSPEQKEVSRKVDAADGFFGTAAEMVKNPSSIYHGVVESLPSMGGGGAIGRGVMAAAPKIAPIIAAAIGEGAIGAGQAAEQIRQQSKDGELAGGQSLAALASGIGTGAFAVVGGRLANKLGINDVDTMLVKGGSQFSEKGVWRRLLEGGISEGALEEMPQSMQEQVWMNAAMGKPLMEGVPESGASGLLTGFAMGGGAAAIPGRTVRQPQDPAEVAADVQSAQSVDAAIERVESLISSPITPVSRDGLIGGQVSAATPTTEYGRPVNLHVPPITPNRGYTSLEAVEPREPAPVNPDLASLSDRELASEMQSEPASPAPLEGAGSMQERRLEAELARQRGELQSPVERERSEEFRAQPSPSIVIGGVDTGPAEGKSTESLVQQYRAARSPETKAIIAAALEGRGIAVADIPKRGPVDIILASRRGNANQTQVQARQGVAPPPAGVQANAGPVEWQDAPGVQGQAAPVSQVQVGAVAVPPAVQSAAPVADKASAVGPRKGLYLQIGDARYEVADYKQASDMVFEARKEMRRRSGGREGFIGFPTIHDESGAVVAHIGPAERVIKGEPTERMVRDAGSILYDPIADAAAIDANAGKVAPQNLRTLLAAPVEEPLASKAQYVQKIQEHMGSEGRDFTMQIDRKKRAVAKSASINPQVVARINEDASKYGIDAQAVASEVERQMARNPVSKGWAPLEYAGVDEKVLGKGKEAKDAVKFKVIPYQFHIPPGETKAPKDNSKLASGLASKMVADVRKIAQRAKRGDKNAKVIMDQMHWYRDVTKRLRQDFGSFGDYFADLLGATSPNTTVTVNFAFAREAAGRFLRGDFDAELSKLDAHLKSGKNISEFPDADKIRRLSGALFGMNTNHAMKAMLGIWRAVEAGSAPKAINFAQNLIGASDRATIDVWAARYLQRLAGLPRIPIIAEGAVGGNHLANPAKVGGAFGFGQDVFQRASDTLKKSGLDITPADLQAMMWFHEKELWGKNGWTNKLGEGGSFEEELSKNYDATSRYQYGLSAQQGETAPTAEAAGEMRSGMDGVLKGDKDVIMFKVIPTKGGYMSSTEESFDIEIVAKDGWDYMPSLRKAIEQARKNNQDAVMLARVVKPGERNANARPGVEVYLKKGAKEADVLAVSEALRDAGAKENGYAAGGFTLVVDPRARRDGNSGEYIGIRVQYVPEIFIRAYHQGWATGKQADADYADLTSGDEARVRGVVDRQRFLLSGTLDGLRANDAVEFAERYNYDTLLIGKEEYSAYEDPDGRAARGDQVAPRAQPGQPIGERLRAAASQHGAVLRSQDGQVQDAVRQGLAGRPAEAQVTAQTPPSGGVSVSDVPPALLKKITVEVEQYHEDGGVKTVKVPADVALADTQAEIDAFKKLLDCVRAA